MGQYQIEKEYKMMLAENEFYCLKNHLSNLVLHDQTNFYYTAKNNMGMRIRLLNDHYYFTLKHFIDNQVREYEWEVPGNDIHHPSIDKLLNELQIEDVKYLGTLRTRRYVLDFPKGTLCLDQNEYLGKVDYELEYELKDYQVDDFKTLEDLLASVELTYRQNKFTKYGRFLKRHDELSKQKQVAILCADGLEECEALVVADLLKRANINVLLVSLNNHLEVISTHDLHFNANVCFKDVDFNQIDAVILPGGWLGKETLSEYEPLGNLLKQFNNEKKFIGAICAAPAILAEMGLVDNLQFTVYPGCCDSSIPSSEDVVIKDNIITAKALGSAYLFAKAIIEKLKDHETATAVLKQIYY